MFMYESQDTNSYMADHILSHLNSNGNETAKLIGATALKYSEHNSKFIAANNPNSRDSKVVNAAWVSSLDHAQ